MGPGIVSFPLSCLPCLYLSVSLHSNQIGERETDISERDINTGGDATRGGSDVSGRMMADVTGPDVGCTAEVLVVADADADEVRRPCALCAISVSFTGRAVWSSYL